MDQTVIASTTNRQMASASQDDCCREGDLITNQALLEACTVQSSTDNNKFDYDSSIDLCTESFDETIQYVLMSDPSVVIA